MEDGEKVRGWKVVVERIEGEEGGYKREVDGLFCEVVEGIGFEWKWYGDEMKEV